MYTFSFRFILFFLLHGLFVTLDAAHRPPKIPNYARFILDNPNKNIMCDFDTLDTYLGYMLIGPDIIRTKLEIESHRLHAQAMREEDSEGLKRLSDLPKLKIQSQLDEKVQLQQVVADSITTKPVSVSFSGCPAKGRFAYMDWIQQLLVGKSYAESAYAYVDSSSNNRK